MDKRVRPLRLVAEDARRGLFGAAVIGEEVMFCHARHVFVLPLDQVEMRPMTDVDVEALRAAGAIDDATAARQVVRVLP